MSETRVDERRQRSLLRDSSATSVAAMAAVGSGLLLDLAIAARYGAGTGTDAFFAATRLPLGLATVATVVGNQVLVPTVTTWFASPERHPRPWVLVARLLALATVGGVLAADVLAMLAPAFMRVLAPGFDDATVALSADLLRVLAVVLPLAVLAEVLRATLNARRSFVLPAAVNLALNGTAAVLVLAGLGGVHAIAWAFVAGHGVRVLVLLVATVREGLRPTFEGALLSPELRDVGRLLGRPATGAALNPLARAVEQVLLSFLPAGSVTIVNYAYRLISAIGGTIFFRSVMVTVMPAMTEAAADMRVERLRAVAGRGLRLMLVVAVPLTLLTSLVAAPAVEVVFGVGDLSAEDAALLGALLGLYGLSLLGSAVQRALLAPFYAMLDTHTPLRNTVYGIAANLALLALGLAVVGTGRSGVLAVGVAYALAQYVNVAHAALRLRDSVGLPDVDLPVVARSLGPATLVALAVLVPSRMAIAVADVPAAVLLAAVALVAAAGVAPFVRPARQLLARPRPATSVSAT